MLNIYSLEPGHIPYVNADAVVLDYVTELLVREGQEREEGEGRRVNKRKEGG